MSTSSTPTWAAAGRAATPADVPVEIDVEVEAHRRPPVSLVLAVVGVAVLVAVDVAEVLGRDHVRVGSRVLLVGVLAAQLPLAALALRRSAGAALALVLFGAVSLAAAVAAGSVALVLGAAAVLVLLGRSLRWFPTWTPA